MRIKHDFIIENRYSANTLVDSVLPTPVGSEEHE